ncbi:MAG: hypothetical protein GY725_18985 [bacterium]|nr:hypothetical protein [bacterium]
MRRGRSHVWHNGDLNAFMPVRMSAAQAAGFEGRVLVIDPDIFAVGDLTPLLNLEMGGRAILARPGRDRFNQPYNSSVMLLDCAKLEHWRFDQQVDRMFAHEIDYQQWAMLAYEDPATIGLLDEEWNHLDTLTDETRILHLTRALTQPWKTGLPVDFDWDQLLDKTALGPLAKLAIELRRLRSAMRRAGSSVSQWVVRDDVHRAHPDPRQERSFMELLKLAQEHGEISREEIQEQIDKRHVRADLLECIERL